MTECIDDVVRDVAGVGEDAKPFAGISLLENELQGFAGVMRYRDWKHFDGADFVRLSCMDCLFIVIGFFLLLLD